MKIKSGTMAFVSIGIVLLGIAVTSALGIWTTQSTKTPKKLSSDQISAQGSVESDILEYNPDSIKGSYTFLEISNLYKIPLQDLAAAFMVDENGAGEFKCKDLEGIFSTASNEIGTASVRLFVSLYYGIDYLSVEEIYLPETALEILKSQSKVTSAQIAYMESHIASVP